MKHINHTAKLRVHHPIPCIAIRVPKFENSGQSRSHRLRIQRSIPGLRAPQIGPEMSANLLRKVSNDFQRIALKYNIGSGVVAHKSHGISNELRCIQIFI